MGFHIAVSVPTAVASAGVTKLHEADAVLDQTPGHQQLTAEVVGRLLADPIEIEDALRFFREVYDAGRAKLHAGRKLIRINTGGDVGIERVPLTEFAVQASEGFHLPVALSGVTAGWRLQVRDGDGACLKRRGRICRAQVTARQLHGR